MTKYSLTCVNNSQRTGSFAVFQKAPPTTVPGNVFSLAWFARPAAQKSQVTFTWNLDYSFVWSQTGLLKPGINFAASQAMPADPYGQNLVQLTKDEAGATTFANANGAGALGSLTIQQLANVAPNLTSVGVGMSGSGTFAVQAAPNMTAVFTPHPNYWVIFGNYETGDVMNIEDVTGAVELTYGGSQTSQTATLGIDNLITVAS
ncbi:protein rhiA [Pararhizobium sp. LjRoot238]|uniref:protein rhiA n=1 Tax=Pararhizobium sp. LjRoot238 TaxID=3342293 RepID=UPI003ED15F7E